MSYFCTAIAFAAAALAALAGPVDPPAAAPGLSLQLMLPEGLIGRLSPDARYQFAQPAEREIVMVFDQPWEGNHSFYPTIISEGGKMRMYYRGGNYQRENTGRALHVCYAESTDGVNWVRPMLGIHAFNGSTQNNILLEGFVANTFTPFLDRNPAAERTARYKALALLLKPKRGLYAFASADGLRWRQVGEEPVIVDGYFDSQNVSFWDEKAGAYVAYVRGFRGEKDENLLPGQKQVRDGVRSVLVTTSDDYRTWTPTKWLDFADAAREHVYLSQLRRYFRAPEVLIGVYARLFPRRELKTGSSLVVTHPAYTHAGVADGSLMWSFDQKNFHRMGASFIRPGRRFVRWIYSNTFPANALVETPASEPDAPPELSLYVQEDGSWVTAGKHVRLRRYTLRLDGFASLHAEAARAWAETKPLLLPSAERLEVNFATGGGGALQVEIVRGDGTPFPGFARQDCPEIYGDAIDQEIRWKTGANLKDLAGQTVRLRFHLHDCDLFAFRFATGVRQTLPGAHFHTFDATPNLSSNNKRE